MVIRLLVLTALFISVSAQKCADGWAANDGKCFKYFAPGDSIDQLGFTFIQADSFCQQRAKKDGMQNGNLAAMHNDDEKKFVDKLAPSSDKRFWIGMSFVRKIDSAIHKAFWTDGTPVDFGNPVDKPKQYPWSSSNPDNVNKIEYCAMTYLSDGKQSWGDLPCFWTSWEQPMGAVCQAKPKEPCGPKCKKEWSEFGGKCFKVFSDKQSFENAKQLCAKEKADLASIHSKEENEFVRALLANSPDDEYWAGLKMKNPTGKNVTASSWSDGSNVNFGDPTKIPPGQYPWSNGKWHGGAAEPNGDSDPEPCLVISQLKGRVNAEWGDNPCKIKHGFICKSGS